MLASYICRRHKLSSIGLLLLLVTTIRLVTYSDNSLQDIPRQSAWSAGKINIAAHTICAAKFEVVFINGWGIRTTAKMVNFQISNRWKHP